MVIVRLLCSGEMGAGNNDDEIEQLKRENRKLSEENNMLRLKVDILVDMVWFNIFTSSLYLHQLVYVSSQ